MSALEANQTFIQIKIYQGEGRRVEDNLFLGEFELAGIPRGPAGQEVDVRFIYDLNGVLEVEATIVAAKQKVSHVITRHTRGLSAEQIQRALKEMEKLKTHPHNWLFLRPRIAGRSGRTVPFPSIPIKEDRCDVFPAEGDDGRLFCRCGPGDDDAPLIFYVSGRRSGN